MLDVLYRGNVTKGIIKQLEQHVRNFSYIGYLNEGYDNGLSKRQVVIVGSSNIPFGYIIYDVLSARQINNYLINEGCEIELPSHIRKYTLIEIVDVSKNYRNGGIGNLLVSAMRSFGKPIILQGTAKSEGYWLKQGFKRTDDDNIYLLS